jgi:hypothetical protein
MWLTDMRYLTTLVLAPLLAATPEQICTRKRDTETHDHREAVSNSSAMLFPRSGSASYTADVKH